MTKDRSAAPGSQQGNVTNDSLTSLTQAPVPTESKQLRYRQVGASQKPSPALAILTAQSDRPLSQPEVSDWPHGDTPAVSPSDRRSAPFAHHVAQLADQRHAHAGPAGWAIPSVPTPYAYGHQHAPVPEVTWAMQPQSFMPDHYGASAFTIPYSHYGHGAGMAMPQQAFAPYTPMPAYPQVYLPNQRSHTAMAAGSGGHSHRAVPPAIASSANLSHAYRTAQSTSLMSSMPSGPTSSAIGSKNKGVSPVHNQHAMPTGATPAFPRGPPRKPKQSGYALWVGNLPPRTNIFELKDHFARGATTDIESVFLISKSNCAFVNYRTEEACAAAMQRFHDGRFRGARLVCRLRHTSQAAATEKSQGVTATRSSAPMTLTATALASSDLADPSMPNMDSLSLTTAHDSSRMPPSMGVATTDDLGSIDVAEQTVDTMKAHTSPLAGIANISTRFFVLKSLTVEDLQASVRDGIWATQAFNVDNLNHAFKHAQTVYLIFSANKSGEYFGYARMASSTLEDSEIPSRRPSRSASATVDLPASIPTPATETAPAGRVVDDSARGTIFWESSIVTESEDSTSTSPANDAEQGAPDTSSEPDWGKPFKVEWLCTTRLPFYKTRGLRNPWNTNRDIKIARDGTEIEPSVGRTLLDLFHAHARADSMTTGPYPNAHTETKHDGAFVP